MGRVVLAGAGHAHMTLLEAIPELIAEGHRLTVVNPGPKHYYSGMGPGMLGGAYRPEEISFPVRAMVEERGGIFIQNRVTAIDALRRIAILDSGLEIPYDVLSCNLGSFVPRDIVQDRASDVFPVKPIETLYAARQCILNAARTRNVRVGICGGGAAAFEAAGNAWFAGREKQGRGCTVQIFTGDRPLRDMPEKVRRLALKVIDRRRIQIISGSYVDVVEENRINLENGRSYPQDVILLATGVRPSPVFADSGLPVCGDGGLLVNQYLQSVEHPEIFGGGDCISFEPMPLNKVGVYAVRQNPVLLHNARATLAGDPLKPFNPGGGYLMIFNMGGGHGILHKNGIVFGGRAAFWLKDHIDRKFIRRFGSK